MAKRTFPLKMKTEDGEETWVTWTKLPPGPPAAPFSKGTSCTSQTDDIEEAVREWYENQCKPVPSTDSEWITIFRSMELAERAQWEKECGEPSQPVKATFGSPDYWKDYWAKKKAAGYVTKKDTAAVAKNGSKK